MSTRVRARGGVAWGRGVGRGLGCGSEGVHMKGVLAGESYRVPRNQLTL